MPVTPILGTLIVLVCRDRSVSQAEASPLEASGQNDLEAPDPFMDGMF